MTKAGCQEGDRLLVTKPLGIGVLLAAHMRGQAQTRFLQAAIGVMDQSNREALEVLRANGVRAVTDVTGFGLVGHLGEMLRASGTGVELWLEAVPSLKGALEGFDGGAFQRTARGQRAGIGGLRDSRPPSGRSPGAVAGRSPRPRAGCWPACPLTGQGIALGALLAAGYAMSAEIGRITAGSNLICPRRPA